MIFWLRKWLVSQWLAGGELGGGGVNEGGWWVMALGQASHFLYCLLKIQNEILKAMIFFCWMS
jgi:hypothetical protein